MTLLQHYIHLLTLAFQEHEFYAQADIDLKPMPGESAQQHLLDTFQERVLTLFYLARERGEDMTWLQAEQLATSEIEASLRRLAQQPTQRSI